MKYEKQLELVRSGKMPRADLFNLHQKAAEKFRAGDDDAGILLEAINLASPSNDQYILFMGFCPGGKFDERQDIEWKEQGICTFDYHESEHQLERFNQICAGDLVVLKKREQFGKTMKLYGHGRVKAIAYDEKNHRYLKMEWAKQNTEIEVPLMGCNSTVDVRDIKTVENEMPQDFWEWLQ